MLGGGGGAFFQRQFGTAVKLLRNLLAWQGVVADRVLRDVALGSLLNRYLVAALRTCEPLDAAEKCSMVREFLSRMYHNYRLVTVCHWKAT
jgi:GC-rich sequence DNA-binding factor